MLKFKKFWNLNKAAVALTGSGRRFQLPFPAPTPKLSKPSKTQTPAAPKYQSQQKGCSSRCPCSRRRRRWPRPPESPRSRSKRCLLSPLTFSPRSSDRVRIPASCGVFLGRYFGQRLDHLAGSNLMHFIRMRWDRLLVDRISGLVKMLGVSF